MSPIQENYPANSSLPSRFLSASLPLVVVCALLSFLAIDSDLPEVAVVTVLAACGMVMWFGWRSIRRTMLTKCLGVLLVLALALGLGLVVLQITIHLLPIIFILFFVGLFVMAYDFLFRAPREGRLTRSRRSPRP